MDRLQAIAEDQSTCSGSPAALLSAMSALPRLTEADVAEMEANIAAGRLPTSNHDLFSE